MVNALNPVKDTVNAPITFVPLAVLVLAMVGFIVVEKQTPLAVIFAEPLSVTFPPAVAVIAVFAVMLPVNTVGNIKHGPHCGTPLQNIKLCPLVPGFILTHVVPFQYNISPALVPDGIPLLDVFAYNA